MTHWRTHIGKSDWLSVFDIEGHSPVELTIRKWSVKTAHSPDNEDSQLLALDLAGAEKPLGVNVTNGFIIAAMHGENYEQWIGKPITLRTATCKGEPCIRIDAPARLKMPKACPRFQYTDKFAQNGQQQATPTPNTQPATNDPTRAAQCRKWLTAQGIAEQDAIDLIGKSLDEATGTDFAKIGRMQA